ncbi:hypothetical protein HWV62_2262 [Athelia sp. TMB]|nr:hypothetical protein HWV62_2262 [Athelia sp. TMB]
MASVLHHPSSTEPSAYLFAQRVSKEVTGKDGVEVLKEHLLVREFVCSESEMTADGGRHSFEQLVESMLDQPGMREGTEMVMLKVALPIAALFKPPFPSTYNEEDQGFMYRPIENTGPVVSSQLTGEALIDRLYDGASGSAFSTNILAKDAKLTVSGSNVDYVSKAASGNDVTRTFCGKCGSSISHKSAAFGDATAVQTGILFQHFKNAKVAAELFTKDRWVAFEPVSGAAQKEVM